MREPVDHSSTKQGGRLPLSPCLAASILLGVMLCVGLVGWLLNPDQELAAQTESNRAAYTSVEEDPNLILEFEDLYERLTTAVRRRDPGLVNAVATDGGPAERRTIKAIQSLRRDRVLDFTAVEVLSVSIRRVGETGAVLEVESKLQPCFQTESGTDITRGPSAVRRRTEWTLHRNPGGWLLHESILEDQVIVPGVRSAC